MGVREVKRPLPVTQERINGFLINRRIVIIAFALDGPEFVFTGDFGLHFGDEVDAEVFAAEGFAAWEILP